MKTSLICAALALGLVGCKDHAGGTVDAATPLDLGRWLDPSLYDCTSLGADGMHRPDRASPLPVACALDPACRSIQVSGHRGAGGQTVNLGSFVPEDTLAAYRAGIAMGVEFVETDPRPTQDGVLVNIHDDTVDRTLDGTGEVDRLTFAQIRAMKVKADGMPGDFTCEKAPTLTELLQTCVGRVVVLVDANKTDRVDLMVQAIKDAGALDWAIFDTSDLGKIDQALVIEPNIHFQIRPALADVAAQLDHFAPKVPVNVELGVLDVPQVAALIHSRGSRVFTDVFVEDAQVVVTDQTTAWDQDIAIGIDVLESERPDLLVQALRARGLR